MADKWNDEREERWRREARSQGRYGRDDRREAYDRPDYSAGPAEDRSFHEHEHDADWDHNSYNDPLYGDYDLQTQPSGYERGPVFGDRDRGDSYGADRGRGYTRSPPFGGQRAASEQDYDRGRYSAQSIRSRGIEPYEPGWSGYGPAGAAEPRRPRSGGYSGLGQEPDRGRAYQGSGDRGYGTPGSNREPRRDEGGRGFFDRAADTVASWFGGAEEGRQAGPHLHGHRGKGPKGYRRSDQRISDDVHDALTDDPFLDASEINVTVTTGEVTLAGVVADREAKHRAERMVERVSGVDHVQNNLRIGHVQGSKPFETGSNPLTNPGRGFGDSVLEAQAKGETPDASDRTKN